MGYKTISPKLARPSSNHFRQSLSQLLAPCPTCNGTISLSASFCHHCGAILQQSSMFQVNNKSPFALLAGAIGTIALTVGTFCPIVSIPLLGGINILHLNDWAGVTLLILAAFSLVFLFLQMTRCLFYTGLGSSLLIVYLFYSYYSEKSKAIEEIGQEMADSPFHNIANAAIESVQLEWGIGILIVGSALLISASFITDN